MATACDPPLNGGITRSCGQKNRSPMGRPTRESEICNGSVSPQTAQTLEPEAEGKSLGHMLRLRTPSQGSHTSQALVVRDPIRFSIRNPENQAWTRTSRYPRGSRIPEATLEAIDFKKKTSARENPSPYLRKPFEQRRCAIMRQFNSYSGTVDCYSYVERALTMPRRCTTSGVDRINVPS